MPSSRDPQVEILGFLAFKVKIMDPGGADILLDFFMRLNLNFADIPTDSSHPARVLFSVRKTYQIDLSARTISSALRDRGSTVFRFRH